MGLTCTRFRLRLLGAQYTRPRVRNEFNFNFGAEDHRQQRLRKRTTRSGYGFTAHQTSAPVRDAEDKAPTFKREPLNTRRTLVTHNDAHKRRETAVHSAAVERPSSCAG